MQRGYTRREAEELGNDEMMVETAHAELDAQLQAYDRLQLEMQVMPFADDSKGEHTKAINQLIREEIVVFPDGTECGAWDFYRGKAGHKWSYCEQNGGKIENRTEDMGTWTAEYAVCVFPDGSECSEADYIDGKCAPGVYKKWSLDEKKRIRFR